MSTLLSVGVGLSGLSEDIHNNPLDVMVQRFHSDT